MNHNEISMHFFLKDRDNNNRNTHDTQAHNYQNNIEFGCFDCVPNVNKYTASNTNIHRKLSKIHLNLEIYAFVTHQFIQILMILVCNLSLKLNNCTFTL